MRADVALLPARIILNPDDARVQDANRRWQGIPSFEKTAGGTMYCIFYSGERTEMSGNFAVLIRSGDGGARFTSPYMVIEHPDPITRVFDPNLWMDPTGRLWVTWAQSYDIYDGRGGVWAAVCGDPDADPPAFSAPFRISDGVMMNKPTALKNGSWIFPCAIWRRGNERFNSPNWSTEREAGNIVYSDLEPGAYAVETRDQGKSFRILGRASASEHDYEEHMIVERNDGRLWMLIRTKRGIDQSVSTDGGLTWSACEDSRLGGPCSRFFIRRLHDGSLLLVNHANNLVRPQWLHPDEIDGRSHLTAMRSCDEGKTWQDFLLIDERKGVSYPDGMQDHDGTIYIVYDRGRYKDKEILLARFTVEEMRRSGQNARGIIGKVINKV